MKKYKLILFILTSVLITAVILTHHLPLKKDTAENPQNAPESTEKIIEISPLCQYPILPTGCEPTAVATVLNYYGDDITAEEFARDWLLCSNNFYYSNGELFGPSPNDFFVGDPFSKKSYGCYLTPVMRAVNENSQSCRAERIKETSLFQLCKDYIDNDKPILIWATMSMKPLEEGNVWYLKDGSAFTWTAGEHCYVLVGYDERHYFLADPQSGSIIGYEKKLVDKRFEELGSQALYIHTI